MTFADGQERAECEVWVEVGWLDGSGSLNGYGPTPITSLSLSVCALCLPPSAFPSLSR